MAKEQCIWCTKKHERDSVFCAKCEPKNNWEKQFEELDFIPDWGTIDFKKLKSFIKTLLEDTKVEHSKELKEAYWEGESYGRKDEYKMSEILEKKSYQRGHKQGQIAGIEKVEKIIDERIEYGKKYRLESKEELRSGWTGIESGECCEKCTIDKKAVIKSGSAVGLKLLVGCTNPFQLEENYGRKLCQCHLPFRKVAEESIQHQLHNLKWGIDDLLKKPHKEIKIKRVNLNKLKKELIE